MILRIASRVILAACLSGFSAFAMAQEARKPQPPANMKLDAAPAKDAAPDPLAPSEQDVPPPAAPGAPADKPADVAQAPVPEPDPIATQILARRSKCWQQSGGPRGSCGIGRISIMREKASPFGSSKDGFTPNALKVIKEIRNADDWGLDASAFQIPANPGPSAKPEALGRR